MANQRFAPGRAKGTQAFLIALVVVLLGLFAPGWFGAGLLFAIVAVLLVLLSANWRTQRPPVIGVRLVIIAVIVILAISKIS
ncbi:hypothetical protein GCM10023322_27210 [Rugosimonospora acidiphila]|uniref:Uncharacterized protein n=1 Tax=Rugosimonospora acidiphila TaxID=556531 RepID=A0ABP9RSJ2_9ACTN